MFEVINSVINVLVPITVRTPTRKLRHKWSSPSLLWKTQQKKQHLSYNCKMHDTRRGIKAKHDSTVEYYSVERDG